MDMVVRDDAEEDTASDASAALSGSSSERVYRGILRGLYEGRFVPGQRLVEPDLMRDFSAGRSTIREVLNRLSSAGIVSIIRHRGASVRRLSRRDVLELLDLVEIMVGLAARRAAEYSGEGRNAERLQAAEQMLTASTRDENFTDFLDAREAYYRTLVHISGSRELARMFPSMQVNIMRLQFRHFDRVADGMRLADYSMLTQAIMTGDPAHAEASGRAHVRQTMEGIFHLPPRAFEQEG